jgi:ATP-dependent 26S proteasome regulatory subunit
VSAPADPEELARAIVALGRWAQHQLPRPESPLLDRLITHVGVSPRELPVVREDIATYDLVNLQVALDAWAQAGGRDVEAIGLPSQHGYRLGLAELVHAADHGMTEASLQWRTETIGERSIAVLSTGLLLLTDGERRLAAVIGAGHEHFGPGEDGASLEVLAVERTDAEAFVAEIRALMHEHNVYRGRVLEVTGGPEGISIAVRALPEIPRERIVLADGVLERIERHTVGFAAHAERLVAAGRHLKRGLLLHGPPGTGKTLTAMHLAARMPGRTVLLLTGAALYGLGTACTMARSLAPAMVVLEDVDLVAEDRELTEDGSPILFELLNQMDGIAEDADIVFVLTTNRPQVLESALAARPGRIDQAVELGLPDGEGRRRLLAIYGDGLGFDELQLDGAVRRTEGMSPAYIRELVRRASLVAAERGDGPLRVAAADLDEALDEMAASGRVTEVVLGARPPAEPEDPFGSFEDDDDFDDEP